LYFSVAGNPCTVFKLGSDIVPKKYLAVERSKVKGQGQKVKYIITG